MDLRNLNKIYIIESPGLSDMKADRKEGLALSETLKLAQIQNLYFTITSYQELEGVLRQIIEDINSINQGDNALGTATLHFSMHGNEDGLGLTNDDFIDWSSLAVLLDNFNNEIGYLPFTLPNGKRLSPIGLSFSACNGFHAASMKDYSSDIPYTVLIGPNEPVGWSDSLIAFVALYHNILQKRVHFTKAVDRMNLAAGLENVFEIDLGGGLAFKQ